MLTSPSHGLAAARTQRLARSSQRQVSCAQLVPRAAARPVCLQPQQQVALTCFRQRCQTTRRRGISVCAAASPETPPPTEDPEKKKPKSSLTNDLTVKIVKTQYSEKYAKKILDNLSALGLDSVDKKEDMQKFFVSRSVAKLLPRGMSALLNALACYVCFLGFALAKSRGEELGFFSFPAQAASITFGLNFAIETISETVIFVNTFAAAVVFGTNVETFLQAVREQAGIKEKEMSLWEKALAAVSAVKVVEALTSVRDRARSFVKEEELMAAGGAGVPDPRESYFRLAALVTVWDASRLKKFDAREWEMTEKEAVRIAKVFNRYDSDSNGMLGLSELQALTRDLGHELSAAEATVAMEYLDEDNNGTVEFNEFVGWWTGVRAVKPPPGGGEAPVPPKVELPAVAGAAGGGEGAAGSR